MRPDCSPLKHPRAHGHRDDGGHEIAGQAGGNGVTRSLHSDHAEVDRLRDCRRISSPALPSRFCASESQPHYGNPRHGDLAGALSDAQPFNFLAAGNAIAVGALLYLLSPPSSDQRNIASH